MENLHNINCFLLDMDGTIYLGDQLIDGSKEFLDLLKEQNKDFIFLTNNSSKNKYIYQEKLANLGIEVDAEKVFTSGEATVIYLKSLKPNAKVFLLGTEHLEQEFKQSGFKLIKDRSEKPDYVVLGFDTTLTYEKLWIACDLILDGVEYIATHPDLNCPLQEGKFMPDAGAIIEFIKSVTNKSPYIVGKPNKTIIDAICSKYQYDKSEIAMVGDRLYTDIKTGQSAGITSILVLTGETTLEEYKESDINASYVFDSVKEITEQLLAYKK